MGRRSLWVVAGLLVPAAAMANSFENEYPDNSARALGRAGAFAVRADDPSAIYYNPAGLVRQHGFGVLLSVNLVGLEHSFDASDDIVSRRPRVLGGVSQQTGMSAAPMLAASFRFDALPDFAFGAGVYGPPGKQTRFYGDRIPVVSIGDQTTPENNPVNWIRANGLLVESDLILAYPTLSAAYQILPELAIGLSLQAAVMTAKISKTIGPPEPAVTNLEIADWFTPTAILGLHYAPVPWLEVGATIRPGFTLEARGKISLRQYTFDEASGFSPNGELIPLQNAAGQPDDGVTFTYNHPLVVRGGVRLVQPRFDVEVNYIYQRTRTHDAFTIDVDATQAILGGTGVPVPLLRDERQYVDTHEVRLGGDFVVKPGLLVARAGGAYSTGASPDAYTTLDFPALDRWSLHAGVTVVAPWGLEFDLGYAYVGLVEREITDSKSTLIDITQASGVGAAVGDGTFGGNYHILGLAVTWRTGAEPAALPAPEEAAPGVPETAPTPIL